MRVRLGAVAIASISWTAAPAVAFLSHSSGYLYRAAISSPPRVDCLRSATVDTSEQLELPLPPKDETWGPRGVLKELRASPDIPEDALRYDTVGASSGGVWKSIVVGFLPSTIVTLQQGAKWLSRQEAAGNVYQVWPPTIIRVLGEKSLINLGVKPELHAIGRQPLSKALSPKATLELTATMTAVVENMMMKLESFAESGQEVTLQDELRFFTLEAITDVFFGDYATPELFDEVKRFLPVISWGLVGLPVRCPWPLNKLPVFGFGKAMDAREAFKTTILRILGERRAERASTDAGGRDGRSAGILDSLIELQQKQMGRKDGQEDMFDDDFIVDNVITSLFAGTDTTSVTLTRVLQLLATADDGNDIINKLRQELSNTATGDDDELDDTTGTGKGGASRVGIFASFPLLDAVILESFRVHPVVAGVSRKARNDVSYNGYRIPSGSMININIIHGLRASSLYEEPKKFCPFRFMHGGKSKGDDNAAGNRPAGGSTEEPPPPMFGVGRHTCPGRELSKLEMLLFLKAFLTKFDYEVVEGQSFKGVLPGNGPKDRLRVILKTRSAAG